MCGAIINEDKIVAGAMHFPEFLLLLHASGLINMTGLIKKKGRGVIVPPAFFIS